MKNIIFLTILTAISLHFIACEDTEDVYLTNTWTYNTPYVEFAYNADSIYFGSSNKQMNMAVNDFKSMFTRLATSKMQEYFKGMEFYSQDSLYFKAQTRTGDTILIRASYYNDSHYMDININSKDLERFMGEGARMIPAISFKYSIYQEKLTIFFNEVYIQSIFENQQIQNMILPMIGRSLNPQFDRMPAQAQQSMLNGLQKQLSEIIDRIQVMKIGFVLK